MDRSRTRNQPVAPTHDGSGKPAQRPSGNGASSGPQSQGGHIVLCDLGGLGFRTLQELHRFGEDVVVVTRQVPETFAAPARAMGAIIIEGDYRSEHVLRGAGVASARAIILTAKDDVDNLHAGLIAQDLNPEIRIVMHMFNIELGQQVQALFENCTVLSSSAIAAPAFVAAALYLDWEQRIDVAGRSLIVRAAKAKGRVWGKGKGAVGISSDPNAVLPLACLKDDGTAVLFPDQEPKYLSAPLAIGTVCNDVLYLVDGGPTEAAIHPKRRISTRQFRPDELIRSVQAIFLATDLRLRWLLGILIALVAMSALVFYLFGELSLLDAIYFIVTTITTTGFGDITYLEAHPALKLYVVFLMLVGAASLGISYALLTDVIVGARLAQALYGVHKPMRNHVVVCGLGNIGYRVVESLARMRVPVAAAELDLTSRFLPVVRSMGVPVTVADARLPQTLQSLEVSQARCLVAAIDDDIANLQAALSARSLNPELRVVLRLFDPDLSARMERTFEIHISRSPAALAAPALMAAAVGGNVIAPIQAGDKVAFIAQTSIDPGSEADGKSITWLEETASAGEEIEGLECRVMLVIADGKEIWRPAPDLILCVGYQIAVVVTQGGLAHVLALTNPGPPGSGLVTDAPAEELGVGSPVT